MLCQALWSRAPSLPCVLQTLGVLLAPSAEHAASAKHLTWLHPEHAANRESIRPPTVLEVLTPNMTHADSECQLLANKQLTPSAEGTDGAVGIKNCAVNTGYTSGCEL